MVFSSFLFQNRRFEFWTTIFPLYHAVAVFYLCKFNYFICYFASFDDFWFFVGFFVVFLSRLRKMWSMMLDVRTHKIAIDFNNFYFELHILLICNQSSFNLVIFTTIMVFYFESYTAKIYSAWKYFHFYHEKLGYF